MRHSFASRSIISITNGIEFYSAQSPSTNTEPYRWRRFFDVIRCHGSALGYKVPARPFEHPYRALSLPSANTTAIDYL